MADATLWNGAFVDAAAAIVGGGHVISQIRSHQTNSGLEARTHVADYCATQPGTPQPLRIRGGHEMVATVGRGGCTSAPTTPNGLFVRANTTLTRAIAL